MTRRLYYADSYLREFDAQVVELTPVNGRPGAVLDQTAFYPTSGGQPHDLGTLDGAVVVDVVDGGEAVLHVLTAEIAGRVRGRIDWPRRFDHMQQHTGQHILSGACLQALGAQTRSVHFGEASSTVDLEIGDLDAGAAARAEDLANEVVFEDRPVTIAEVDEVRLPELGLRRPAKKTGRIRIVEVQEFDRSACGGTHVRRTGEVGLIKILRWERHKEGMRAEFTCGRRALRDYGWKNALVVDLAARLTVKDAELGEAVSRLSDQVKERERALADARDRVVGFEARDRLAVAPGSPKIIADVITGRPFDEVTALAGRIVAAEPAVAVLATPEGRIVLARSPDVEIDAGVVLRRAIEPLGGRGGGRPEFAQGAVPADAVAQAVALCRIELAGRDRPDRS